MTNYLDWSLVLVLKQTKMSSVNSSWKVVIRLDQFSRGVD